jgi:hypothetical protein
MGGIPFVALGDFRQVAPVVKAQGRTAALLASVKSSSTWSAFLIHTLHQPIRSAADPHYTQFVDNIGENYHQLTVAIDNIPSVHDEDEAIAFLFPPHILRSPIDCLRRAFLSPKNKSVDDFNKRILDLLPGELRKP